MLWPLLPHPFPSPHPPSAAHLPTHVQGDISAGKMIFGVEGVDPARRARLVELLDIDLYQRITTMSDGQKRRVQICMGLLKPYEVGAAPLIKCVGATWTSVFFWGGERDCGREAGRALCGP